MLRQFCLRASRASPAQKSGGGWGWFFPKTFQGVHFLFSGSLSWLMYIWAICRWNKFDEKAQCKTDIRICNWSQINCLKKSQIFKKGISFKNNSEKNIRLVISCFFRFWLATPKSTIKSPKFTMWPKKWNLLFSWTKCCKNFLSKLCEKWSQWNISLKSHFSYSVPKSSWQSLFVCNRGDAIQ